MRRALDWLKRWRGAMQGVVLVVLGAGWLWRRERGKRLDAEAEAEVARLKEKVATAKAVRDQLLKEVGEDDQAIGQLDVQIDANEHEILTHYEQTEGLTR